MIVRGRQIMMDLGKRAVFVGERDDDDLDCLYLKFTNGDISTYLKISRQAGIALRALLYKDNDLGEPKVYEYADPEPTMEWQRVDDDRSDN